MSAEPVTAATSIARNPLPPSRLISLGDIAESTNPRREYTKAEMEELEASVHENGILQPIWVEDVSPKTPTFDLIAGYRRFRIAKKLNLGNIPAIVYRGLSREQFLALQLIENLTRKDLTPLEEADGLAAVLKLGRSAKDLAIQLGKDVRSIHRMAVLANLPKPARDLVAQERIPLWAGVEVMRIADAGRRNEAANALARRAGQSVLAEPVIRELLRPFFLELRTAPFDTASADLVPAAGACGPCDFRTGNQSALFGADGNADVCTKPSCFDSKQAAYRKILSDDAKSRGWAVATAAETKKFCPDEWSQPAAPGYVDVDTKPTYDSKKTYLQLIGGQAGLKKAVEGSVTLMFHPKDGHPVHLIRATEARQLAKDAGNGSALKSPSSAGTKSSSSATHKKTAGDRLAEKAKREQKELNQKAYAIARKNAGGLVAAQVERKGCSADAWRVIIHMLCRELEYGVSIDGDAGRKAIEQRRNVEDLTKAAAKMSVSQLAGLAMEIVSWSIDEHGVGGEPRLKDVLKAHGVDFAALEKAAQAELSKPATEDAKAVKAPAAKKATGNRKK